MELQAGQPQFGQHNIRTCAISYDPVDTLRDFAHKHRITYPLLSDAQSAVIREYGIFNTLVPEGHRWYGVPFPGTYIVDEHGYITHKSFYANHGIRDSIARILRDSFHITPEGAPVHILETDDLKAAASLTAGTVRRGQVQTFVLDLQIEHGRHIYGPRIPGGYTPTTLSFDEIEDIQFGQVQYPDPQPHHLKTLGETLPVYRGRIRLSAAVLNRRREDFTLRARLDYQACDDRDCYLPRQLVFEFPLTCLNNA